jgi:hypothetical protein
MSALLQGVPIRVDDGSIYAINGITPVDHFHNGLPYEADGALSMDNVGAITHHHQGLPFTALGRLAIGLTPTYFGSGAAPFNVDGRLAVATVIPTHFSSGVGYTGAGISVNAIAPVGAYSNAYSTAYGGNP